MSPWRHTLDSDPVDLKYRCHWTPPLALDPFDAPGEQFGLRHFDNLGNILQLPPQLREKTLVRDLFFASHISLHSPNDISAFVEPPPKRFAATCGPRATHRACRGQLPEPVGRWRGTKSRSGRRPAAAKGAKDSNR